MITTILRSDLLAIALSLPLLFAATERNLIATVGPNGAATQAVRGDAVADNATPGNTGGNHDDNGKCGEGCAKAHNGN